MNRLPAVLQKEIWEYVRGDRQHWKIQYDQVINHLLGAIQLAEEDIFWRDLPTTKSSAILASHANEQIGDYSAPEFAGWKSQNSFFVDSEHEFVTLRDAWHKYERLFLS